MSTPKNLPPEIIQAILGRLPATSLGRFKSVSKPWQSLISNPQFTKTHLNLNNDKISNLILVSDFKSIYSLDLNELQQSLNSDDVSVTGKELSLRPPAIRWEQICGSCDGIVLAKDEDDSIFLLNPTTRELFQLPVSPFALPIGESLVMYGFGYDSSTDDYKVVSIYFWDTDNEYNPDCTDMFVSIYSLKNDSWRKLRNSPYDHAVGHLVSGVFINGNLHWLTSTRPGYSSTICAFNLANEEFVELELPDSIDNDRAVFCKVVVLGGKLALFGSRLGSDVWVMEEYGVGGSWIKVSIHGVEIDPAKPVCSIDGSNHDIVLGDEEEDVVFVYNVDKRRCRHVRIEGGPDGFALEDTFGTFVESIVSPTCIRGNTISP